MGYYWHEQNSWNDTIRIITRTYKTHGIKYKRVKKNKGKIDMIITDREVIVKITEIKYYSDGQITKIYPWHIKLDRKENKKIIYYQSMSESQYGTDIHEKYIVVDNNGNIIEYGENNRHIDEWIK